MKTQNWSKVGMRLKKIQAEDKVELIRKLKSRSKLQLYDIAMR